MASKNDDRGQAGGLGARLLHAIGRLAGRTPGPDLIERVNDLRRSQVSLDHRINRAVDSLRENSARVDDLKAALQERLDAVERLRLAHEGYSGDIDGQDREVRVLVEALREGSRRGRLGRDILIAAGALIAGLLLGGWLGGGSAEVDAGAGTASGAAVQSAPSAPDAGGAEAAGDPAEAADPKAGEEVSPPAVPVSGPSVTKPDAAAVPAPEPSPVQAMTQVPPTPVPEATVAPSMKETDAPQAPAAAPDAVPEPAAAAEAEGAPPEEPAGQVAPASEQPPAPSADLPRLKVVNVDLLRVRSEPSTEAQILVLVPTGSEVRVLEAREDWVQIETPEQVKGWVYGSFLSEPD